MSTLRRILFSAAFLALLAFFAAPAAAQTTVSLPAFDGKCINSATNANLNDNRFRAYWNTSYYDGFVKFDLSSIPDTATILSMDLTAYHEAGFSNPFNDPEVRVYRTAGDSWSRGATDNHPGLNEVLTPTHTGFPAADLVPVVFNLDVAAVAWSGDLADDVLSLVLHNEAGTVGRYSYVYFYSSDSSPAPPVLDVTYVDGGLSLSMTGNCPGPVKIDVNGATPGGSTVIAATLNGPGAFTVPAGNPCAGTVLGINAPIFRFQKFIADASGNVTVTVNIPQQLCRRLSVQAIDLRTCGTSNVVNF
ncbi:MAG TPA: DNRLRE domain-containing protein [Planctomycetota bacterium]